MTTIPAKDESGWWCPLLGKKISEGRCLDINNDRLGYFHTGSLKLACEQAGKTADEVNVICEACQNLPI